MRPCSTESETGGNFFSGLLGRGFDGGAERVADDAGIFPVSVVNAPQFGFGSGSQIHADE